jgi:hypothetical protein
VDKCLLDCRQCWLPCSRSPCQLQTCVAPKPAQGLLTSTPDLYNSDPLKLVRLWLHESERTCACARCSSPAALPLPLWWPAAPPTLTLAHLPWPADADRLVSAADLAQFAKLIVAVAKKYFNLPGGGAPRMLGVRRVQ